MSLELGDFLRSRRNRLSPREVGLGAGRRRRTAGLRREEVAELAGIGVDWYTRLEQGRAGRPSETTLISLAQALKLTKAETLHLKRLVKASVRAPFVRETPPDNLRRIVEALNLPAYVSGRRFDVLVWNAAADDIFRFSQVPEARRNTLLFLMTDPVARRLFGAGWAMEAERVLSLFRPAYDMYSADPAFTGLIDRLREGCPEFEGWWRRHEVRTPSSGRKALTRPEGRVTLEYASFQSNDNADLKLTLFRACGDD